MHIRGTDTCGCGNARRVSTRRETQHECQVRGGVTVPTRQHCCVAWLRHTHYTISSAFVICSLVHAINFLQLIRLAPNLAPTSKKEKEHGCERVDDAYEPVSSNNPTQLYLNLLLQHLYCQCAASRGLDSRIPAQVACFRRHKQYHNAFSQPAPTYVVCV